MGFRDPGVLAVRRFGFNRLLSRFSRGRLGHPLDDIGEAAFHSTKIVYSGSEQNGADCQR